MTKRIIHINELGPLQGVDIELAQLMLFTGASNLGKSYVNFLCYYVFSLFTNNRVYRFLSNKIEGKMALGNQFSFSFSLSDLRLWMMEDVKSFMRELLNYPALPCNVSFDFGEEKEYVVTYKEQNPEEKNAPVKWGMLTINENRTSFIMLIGSSQAQIISANIGRFLTAELFGKELSRSYLLPPGRASLLDNSFSVQSQASKLGIYNIFLRDYDIIMNSNRGDEVKKSDMGFFKSRIQKLINCELVTTKEGVMLKLGNGQMVPLSAAASSIKELSPLLFWVQNCEIKSGSICIEEPEAHAHPEMQFNIADLLVACVNKGAFMQVTTHSDYLLSRVNQLIKLDKVKNAYPEEFRNFCQKYAHNANLTLNAEKINAYYFYMENGRVKVKKQDAREGIPFDSFSSIVQKQIDWDDALDALNVITEDEQTTV